MAGNGHQAERRKGGARRLSDQDRYSMFKLGLTMAIAVTPIIAGILVMYGDIRVLSADLTNERRRATDFENFVKARDPLKGSELRQLLATINASIHQLQYEIQECKISLKE